MTGFGRGNVVKVESAGDKVRAAPPPLLPLPTLGLRRRRPARSPLPWQVCIYSAAGYAVVAKIPDVTSSDTDKCVRHQPEPRAPSLACALAPQPHFHVPTVAGRRPRSPSCHFPRVGPKPQQSFLLNPFQSQTLPSFPAPRPIRQRDGLQLPGSVLRALPDFLRLPPPRVLPGRLQDDGTHVLPP